MEFTLTPLAHVRSPRAAHLDDYWRGVVSTLVLADGVPDDALAGLESFSHIEVVYLFDQVDPASVVWGSRHPRNRTDWPRVGILAQRGRKRPNRLGLSRCRVLRVDGRTVTVSDLDAIDGTPVLDIKPLMVETLPTDPVRQPDWAGVLMDRYYRETAEDPR